MQSNETKIIIAGFGGQGVVLTGNVIARAAVIEGKNITKAPTFIIYTHNQEKGRIIENPIKSVEEDLLNIINK